jgi:hypothetical protein
MSAINDGGPAFPIPGAVNPSDNGPAWAQEPYSGMSLRDWFAGQALAGILACGGLPGKPGRTFSDLNAEAAYKQADAMLAERAQKAGAA